MWSDKEEIRSDNETEENHVHETRGKSYIERGKSCIKSPEWLISKRATINPKNKDNKCFQYSITVALNHQNIENHPERISNIKPFIDQYNWEGIIEFPTGIKDWKTLNEILRQMLLRSCLYRTIQIQ